MKPFLDRPTLHVALILLLAVVVYGHLLAPGKVVFSPHSDFVTHGFANKQVLSRSIQDGRGIPSWRSDQNSGSSAWVKPNAVYFYPTHWPFYFLSPGNAIGITYFLRFVVAALTTYLAVATIGLGTMGRLAAAIAMLLNFKFIISLYAGWTGAESSALVPLFFAAEIYLFRKRNLMAMLLVSIVTALTLHSGHPQFMYYGALFTVGLFLIHVAQQWSCHGRPSAARLALLGGAGVALGLGMASHLLLPQLKEFGLLTRGDTSFEFFTRGASLTLGSLLTMLHPEVFGTPIDGSYPSHELWEDAAYFGIIPLSGALVACVVGRRRWAVRLLVSGFVLSLLLATWVPLQRFAYETLPGFKFFRAPGRVFFVSAFFCSVLFGFGAERVAQLLRDSGKRRVVTWVTCIVLTCMVLEGSYYARRYLWKLPVEQAFPVTSYSKVLAADHDSYRIAPLVRPTVNYGWAAPMGLELITGYDPINYSHYDKYFNVMQGIQKSRPGARVWTDLRRIHRWDLLDALNVKYLVSPAPLPKSEHLTLASHWSDQPAFQFYKGMATTDIYLYENLTALPRAYLATKIVWARSDAQELELLQSVNLHESTVVRGPANSDRLPESATHLGNDTVRVLEAADGLLALEVNVSGPRLVAISEVWHPGWEATLNKTSPLELFRTNRSLLGCFVPSGTHTIELQHHTPWALPGLVLSATGWSLFVGLLFLARRRFGVEPHRD